MQKRKSIIIVFVAGALLVVFLFADFFRNSAQKNINNEEKTTFVKDSDEILTPSQWVEKSLLEIIKIQPGMKRGDLNRLFLQDGGISSRAHSRYVFRKCAIKIDVEFGPAGKIERDEQGRWLGAESDDDVIKKISKPYLEFEAQD